MIDRVERFRYLSSHYSHGRKESLPEWIAAQREMFELAQTLCFMFDPDLQTRLQSARRTVVRYLQQHRPPEFYSDVTMTVNRQHYLRWQDFQITPEISFDFSLKGVGIPKSIADQLIKVHRLQVRTVMSIINQGL